MAGSCPDSHKHRPRLYHPNYLIGSQQQTHPQADEELLLTARHHAAVVQHWTDLLQGFGGEQRGLIAEDVNLSALQPQVRENMAELGEGTGAQYGRGQAGRGEGQEALAKTCPPAPPALPNHALTGI